MTFLLPAKKQHTMWACVSAPAHWVCVFGSDFKVGSGVKSCRNHMETSLCSPVTKWVCIHTQHLSTQQVKPCTRRVTQPWTNPQHRHHICLKSTDVAFLPMNNWYKYSNQSKCSPRLCKNRKQTTFDKARAKHTDMENIRESFFKDTRQTVNEKNWLS